MAVEVGLGLAVITQTSAKAYWLFLVVGMRWIGFRCLLAAARPSAMTLLGAPNQMADGSSRRRRSQPKAPAERMALPSSTWLWPAMSSSSGRRLAGWALVSNF